MFRLCFGFAIRRCRAILKDDRNIVQQQEQQSRSHNTKEDYLLSGKISLAKTDAEPDSPDDQRQRDIHPDDEARLRYRQHAK